MLISFFMANQLTMVFSISQIVIFITPALYSYEAKKIRNLFFFSLLLWLLNVIFLNSFMFSHVFNFFISFQGALFEQVTSVHFEIRVSEYLKFYKSLFYFSAFSFQIFLFIFLFLTNLSNKEKFLKNYRKFFFFLLLL